MKIECFFSKGCKSNEELEENLKRALNDEGIEAEGMRGKSCFQELDCYPLSLCFVGFQKSTEQASVVRKLQVEQFVDDHLCPNLRGLP